MATADSYSAIERRFVKPVRGLLLRIYAPVVRPLVHFGVSPHLVSLTGPVLGIVFVCVVRSQPRLAFAVWFISLAVDGVDGAVARQSGRASEFGALMDQFCDHIRETLIVAGLAASGAISPLWSTLYPLAYVAVNVVLFLGNYYGAPAPVAIKSWMVLYPAILAYLIWGRNGLEMATPLSIAFMAYTVVHGLLLLSRAMAKKEEMRHEMPL